MKSMCKGAFSALVVVLALSGLTAASALAAGAPVVETKPASSVTGSTAVLNGHVNPNGAGTKFHFEYGTSISYGSKTLESTEGTSEKSIFRLISGLTSNTTYHFRLVATNSYGTSYGKDESFATLLEKPEVVVKEGKVSELAFTITGSSVQVGLGGGENKILECTSAELSGHFINSKEFEGTMTWQRCFGGNGSVVCTNGKEQVQSEPLKGTLGYINRAKKEVGLRLAGKSSEVWANKMNCFDYGGALIGSLGGQLSVPVNTKIHTTERLWMDYNFAENEEDKEITGELGGQLLFPINGKNEPFGFSGDLSGKANREFEIQA